MALTTDLVSYYKLDETSGTTATDSVGSNDGTIGSDATYTSSGKIGGARDFDGVKDSDAYIDITGVSTGTSYSFNAWVKTLNGGRIVDSDSGRVIIGIDETSGYLKLYSANTWYSDNLDISDGLWHYISVVASGTSIKFYIDNSLSYSTTVSSSSYFGSTTLIGQHYNNGNNVFDGLIDEVGIWSRALSATEVSELYNSGDGLAYPFSTGTNMKINIGDTFKDVASMKINIGDVWKDVTKVQINVGDSWKTVF